MTRLIAAVSASPDGCLAGPDPGRDNDRTRAVALWHLVDPVDPAFATAAHKRAEATASESGKKFDLILAGRVCHGRLGDVSLTGRRSDAASWTPERATGHRRSAVHARAAKRALGIDRDASGLRPRAVIR